MNFDLHDVVGTVGAAMIVVTYLLIQLRKMRVPGVRHSLLNGVGAALILYSLTVDFNLSAFFIETFWLLISCIGLVQALGDRSRSG
ncbi:MAG: hypothetical protein RJQ10_07690 [Haliea sp.]|uniref:CBU_0592 family membrane protein n=1 Tax=Haliea sp. TaxID=1932666 RepID=UPI0032EEFFD4